MTGSYLSCKCDVTRFHGNQYGIYVSRWVILGPLPKKRKIARAYFGASVEIMRGSWEVGAHQRKAKS